MKKTVAAYITLCILVGMGLLIYHCVDDFKNLFLLPPYNTGLLRIITGILYLAVLAAIAESQSLSIDGNKALSIAFAICLSALLVYGFAAAAIVSFCTIFFSVVDFGRGRKEHVFNTPIYKTLMNCANYIISVLALGYVYKALGGQFLITKLVSMSFFTGDTITQINRSKINLFDGKIVADLAIKFVTDNLPIIIVSLVAYVVVDNLLIMLYFIVASGPRPSLFREWLRIFQWSVISMVCIGMLGIFLGSIFFIYGPYIVLLFFAPFLMFRYAYAGMTTIQKGYIDTIQAFSAALEAKDHYTIGHARRVEKYCEIIAAEMGLSMSRTKVLKFASLLHDIGKIGISESILNKADRLTEAEFEEIKKHPVIAAQMLENIQFLRKEVRIIRAHHVHYDGKGYPADAAEDAKMLEAQILCAADSFDAMTSDRAYRPAMAMEEAIDEMVRYSGTQFAPEVVDAFVRGLNRRKSKDELNELMK